MRKSLVAHLERIHDDYNGVNYGSATCNDDQFAKNASGGGIRKGTPKSVIPKKKPVIFSQYIEDYNRLEATEATGVQACPLCPQVFIRKTILDMHVRMFHKKKTKEELEEEAERLARMKANAGDGSSTAEFHRVNSEANTEKQFNQLLGTETPRQTISAAAPAPSTPTTPTKNMTESIEKENRVEKSAEIKPEPKSSPSKEPKNDQVKKSFPAIVVHAEVEDEFQPEPVKTVESTSKKDAKSTAKVSEEDPYFKSPRRTKRNISKVQIEDDLEEDDLPASKKLICDFFTPEEVADNRAANHQDFYDDSVPCEATAAPDEEREPCLEPECDRKFISYFSMMRHVAFFHRAGKTARIIRLKMPKEVGAAV